MPRNYQRKPRALVFGPGRPLKNTYKDNQRARVIHATSKGDPQAFRELFNSIAGVMCAEESIQLQTAKDRLTKAVRRVKDEFDHSS